jgi:hypothetical protein
MSKETSALNGLAVMRDQKLVFFGVRDVLATDLAPDDALAKIREFYAAFDESHPAKGANE